jgi:primosomal protein N' (replication factor Y)
MDGHPVLTRPLLELSRWVADYYVAPIGFVIRAALPPGLLSEATADMPERRRQVIRIATSLPTLAARDEAFGRARRQREAFELLESLGGEAEVAHLESQLGFSRAVLAGLVKKGVAKISDEVVPRDPGALLADRADPLSDGPGGRPEPTPKQAEAIAGLTARLDADPPGVALLRGVTGSGKTLVYLELLEEVVRRGRTAIVLVPEIALTPQTGHRFRAAFGDKVALLHSGLSAAERRDEWEALRRGDKRVAIGARSAVFAPLPDLGAIVVDEEHEGSYKQSDTPRYHARSVAAMRCHLEGALCVLGSATPSLESWFNARPDGRYGLLELPARVTPHPLPEVSLVDMRAVREARRAGGGNGDAPGGDGHAAGGPIVLSPDLRSAVADRLERGEQSILLLNRRGYSTFVQCEACGHVWSCPNCNVSLTYHRRRDRMVCHHCAHEAAKPEQCGECGGSELTFTGLGTEQVERRVGEEFPDARLARMDVDTTSRKWSHAAILDRVRAGEVDILIGTQMIAKGLDLPGITLVGVINADVSLNLPDFRASERTFQLISQVAGRAGRGPRPGAVIVQTFRPDHFALQAATGHDFSTFAEAELLDREEPGYPPSRRLANVVISGQDESAVADTAVELAAWTRALIDDRGIGLDLVGPAPCPIDRVRERWRWHFLLKSDGPAELGAVLRYLATHRGQLPGKMRLEIDRDPEALL